MSSLRTLPVRLTAPVQIPHEFAAAVATPELPSFSRALADGTGSGAEAQRSWALPKMQHPPSVHVLWARLDAYSHRIGLLQLAAVLSAPPGSPDLRRDLVEEMCNNLAHSAAEAAREVVSEQSALPHSIADSWHLMWVSRTALLAEGQEEVSDGFVRDWAWDRPDGLVDGGERPWHFQYGNNILWVSRFALAELGFMGPDPTSSLVSEIRANGHLERGQAEACLRHHAKIQYFTAAASIVNHDLSRTRAMLTSPRTDQVSERRVRDLTSLADSLREEWDNLVTYHQGQRAFFAELAAIYGVEGQLAVMQRRVDRLVAAAREHRELRGRRVAGAIRTGVVMLGSIALIDLVLNLLWFSRSSEAPIPGGTPGVSEFFSGLDPDSVMWVSIAVAVGTGLAAGAAEVKRRSR